MKLFGKSMELEYNGRGECERKLLHVGEANTTSCFFLIIYCSSNLFLSQTLFLFTFIYWGIYCHIFLHPPSQPVGILPSFAGSGERGCSKVDAEAREFHVGAQACHATDTRKPPLLPPALPPHLL